MSAGARTGSVGSRAAALAVCGLLAAGCTPASPAAAPSGPSASPLPAVAATGSNLAARGRAADAFARARGGRTGIVVRDRTTGETWRNAEAGSAFRAASTVKLAIAVDLLVRTRAAGRALDAADRAALTAMIVSSDNAAAVRLWSRAGAAAGGRLAAYGLRDATRTDAWGAVRCTPEDLERLVSYLLERAHPADRALLVGLLRAVVPKQRWGVLGTVAGTRPGGKNGWVPGPAGWSVATVGFLGPGERYTVAVMTAGPAGTDFVAGVETVTGTVTTLFLGLS